MRAESSGTTASERISQPAFCAASFSAGLRNSARGAFYLRAFVRRDDVDLDLAKRQSVTKRNQLRGLFGSLNAGNPRGREDVALYHLVLRNQIECLASKPDFSNCNRCPDTERFARDIDHFRAAVGADMGEAPH